MKNTYFVKYVLIVGVIGGAINDFATANEYDPLSVKSQWKPEIIDLNLNDAGRQRDIPLRIYLPEMTSAAPVVLFSHGLGGSCKNNPYLGNHWSARGYAAVFMQHHGSDETVWQNKPVDQMWNELEKAANLQNFMLRAQDVPAVLDALEEWNTDPNHILFHRLDLEHIGMSGHSFGAITTQAVSGQCMVGGRPLLTDPKIDAAVAMSPSSPPMGSPEQAFGQVKIPWLLMTGTKDVISIGNIDLESRLAVFQALPPGDKYEVVLYNAEHSAFHEGPLPGDMEKRNPNHHRAVLALSTAFWDTYLRGDADARAWLTGDGPASILQSKDRWQKK